jgi:YD repeat-containing protein
MKIDPKGNTYQYDYDSLGRLIREDDPAGGFQSLVRSSIFDGYQVTLTSAMGKTNVYSVERFPTGEQRRVNTSGCCGESEIVIDADGSRTITYPDGKIYTSVQGPDPRWGMQSPKIDSATITTPNGISKTLTSSRTVTLANPADPLSLTQQTETTTINGRTYTKTFDASLKRITHSTPEGRQRFTTVDDLGRIVEKQIAGLTPIQTSYNAKGELASITQGSRIHTFNYDSQGYVSSIVDPLSRITSFGYDPIGRLIQSTSAAGFLVSHGYDPNGNLTSLTPPGRSQHTFNYTPVDLMEDYTPPDVGSGSTLSHVDYNPDRQLLQATRPDGKILNFAYDESGRMTTLTIPRGTISRTYDQTTNRLAIIQAPGGEIIGFEYDGSLLTELTWSGPVSGSVQNTYNNDFGISAQKVNGQRRL